MHIYKFRLLSDVNDDFIRDIEIKASQTFEDFHKIISDCINLNGKELASFHICDQKWNKLKEITLIDMMNGEEPDEDEKQPVMETYLMKDSLIKRFIDEPHQRLLYEYDFLNLQTFFIELLSVYKQKDDALTYPRCTRSKGDLKEEAKPAVVDDHEEDEEMTDQLLKDFDELLDDTFDIKSDKENNDFS
jgi:hypothetical protein